MTTSKTEITPKVPVVPIKSTDSFVGVEEREGDGIGIEKQLMLEFREYDLPPELPEEINECDWFEVEGYDGYWHVVAFDGGDPDNPETDPDALYLLLNRYLGEGDCPFDATWPPISNLTPANQAKKHAEWEAEAAEERARQAAAEAKRLRDQS